MIMLSNSLRIGSNTRNYWEDNYRYQELDYLKCYQGVNKISWHHMSQNQNAIELLRDRSKY